jgi:UPF0042 nucleotide-binding protein
MDATRPERRLIYTVREHVDLVIDTSNLTAAELKRLLTGHFAPRDPRLRVFITFFAYRDRVPRNSDLILDVHFLDNPHYRSELCALTGHDGAVAANGERDRSFAAELRAIGWRVELLYRDLARSGFPAPLPASAQMRTSWSQ